MDKMKLDLIKSTVLGSCPPQKKQHTSFSFVSLLQKGKMYNMFVKFKGLLSYDYSDCILQIVQSKKDLLEFWSID